MRIALVSLDQLWHDKDENYKRCLSFIAEASSHAAELVIFPEMTLTAYSFSIDECAEQENCSPSLSRFAKAASNSALSIVFGASLIESSTGSTRNTFCLARPDGESSVVYSKIHPFSFAGEDKVFKAGDLLGMIRVGPLDIGSAICYDLRFPEMFAAMSAHCNAFIVIANWPERRVDHWRSLLIARAIENQSFVFGVNRTGSDANGLQYQKSSIAVAPDGTLLEPVIAGSELDIYEFDPDDVVTYRSSFPTLRDKRYEMYANMLKKAIQ